MGEMYEIPSCKEIDFNTDEAVSSWRKNERTLAGKGRFATCNNIRKNGCKLGN